MIIHAQGTHFFDEQNRRVMLRGVNLGGSSKVPYEPNGATYIREKFFDHRQLSFVGRPFLLEQADDHLGRLREWGFNFLRLLVTWEAIEHAGPGIYDDQYLDYIVQVVKKCDQFGFNLFIDFHQDVWSRFSGGDGAPGWTLEAVGFDVTHFHETGAALVQATCPPPYPRMLWSTNNIKLACATMFTLFFAGNDFAPLTKIDGQPVQDFLQQHYFSAVKQLAQRLKDQPNVIGYDSINEPYPGYIGWRDLDSTGEPIHLGLTPTPYQSMLLGAGVPQGVGFWELKLTSLQKTSSRLLNQGCQRAWLPGYDCIWKQHGVWDFDAAGAPHLLVPDYFTKVAGKSVDFSRKYLKDFNNRFSQAVASVHPGVQVFFESTADQPPDTDCAPDSSAIVYASHWYDAMVVVTKEYSPWIGIDNHARKVIFTPFAIRRSFKQQLAQLKQLANQLRGGLPFVLGEFGIPFDLHDKRAYQTGDYASQIAALQRNLRAVEDNLLDYTLWNYTPDNSNLHGDQWNDEDFSIFSPDQRTDPRDINSGGRSLQALVRPYPLTTAGELISAHFNPHKRKFTMEFIHDTAIQGPSEIFVPNYQYPHGYSLRVTDGRYEIQRSRQLLLYWPSEQRKIHKIIINP